MTHNDVDRRTAPELPVRTLTSHTLASHTLTPRALARDSGGRYGEEPWLRPLARALPPRPLHRGLEGGR